MTVIARYARVITLSAIALCMTGNTSLASASITIPRMLMAQRTGLLYVKMVTPDLDPDSVKVWLNDTNLVFDAVGKETRFHVSLKFFRKVEAQQSDWEIKSNEVQFTFQKKWEWRYWPRLLYAKKGQGELWDYVGVDWRKWKAEDEDAYKSAGGDDDDWLDEEHALTKMPNFKLEDWDDSAMPLLNRSSMQPWLEGKPVASVLFFDRANKKNMQLHALFASVSKMLVGKCDVARIDKQNNMDLLKKLHINKFPTAQLFLESGETISYDATTFQRGRDLVQYLYRQSGRAWVDLHNSTQANQFLANFSRVALGTFDTTGPFKGVMRKAKQFDYLARSFRARTDLVPLVFARINASEWNQTDLKHFLSKYNVSTPYTGMVMDKRADGVHHFIYKWTHRLLSNWAYAMQFNYLEKLTPDNIQEFRNRGKPMVYIMLNDYEDPVGQRGFLDHLKETVGKQYYQKVSFVYTSVNTVNEHMLKHLRCDYTGKTYAVLEDIENEYLYCATPSATSNLTLSRIQKLLEGFMEQSLDPDKVKSQPPPAKNEGPVYQAVADTLLESVMKKDKDIVLHFYSDTDEKWEDNLFELEKYAEAIEDAKHIEVWRIDGLRNERPKEFPDLGYFPCTWMFPMYAKYEPRQFNVSGGLTSQRLLWWTQYTSSFELEKHMLPPKLTFATGSVIGVNGARPRDVNIKEEILKAQRAVEQFDGGLLTRVFEFKDNFDHSMVEYGPDPNANELAAEVGGASDKKPSRPPPQEINAKKDEL